MKIELMDGGKKEQGYADERRDCTVRATAIALGIPYQEAHEKLAKLGRKNNHGFKYSLAATSFNFELRPDLCCRTIAKILPEMQQGRFVVRVNHHVFAVINGTIYDLIQIKDGQRAKMVYQVKTI